MVARWISGMLKAPHKLAALATAVAFGAVAPAVQAEYSPYALGGSLQLTHDSNVLRTTADQAQADTITSAGVRLGVDQPLGRDQLHVLASFDSNRFGSLGALDNDSYSVLANLDWSAAGLWFGKFGIESARQLYSYDLSASNSFTGLNLERTARAYARAQVGLVTRWTFEAGLEANERSESAAPFAYRDQHRQAVDAGVRYQANPDFQLKGLFRLSHGRSPSLGTGDAFNRNDLEGTFGWQVTGASLLDGRLTWSQEHHSLQTVRSANLWSGTVGWKWQPTAKLVLSARLARDRDAGSNASGAGDNASLYTDSRQRTTLGLNAAWSATGKVQFSAAWSHARRELDSALVDLGVDRVGSDTADTFTLGVAYQPLRSVDLGCNASYVHRSVTGDGAGLSYPYSARQVGCSGQVWWR